MTARTPTPYRGASWLMLVALTALFVAGIAQVYSIRFRAGEGYPVFSSKRADKKGCRALHDALDRMPGGEVERWLDMLDRLPRGSERTLVLAGFEPDLLKSDTRESRALDRLVRAGAHAVIALDNRGMKIPMRWLSGEEEAEPAPTASKDKTPLPKRESFSLRKAWEIGHKPIPSTTSTNAAVKGATVPATGVEPDISSEPGWVHQVILSASNAAWQVLLSADGSPAVMRRDLDRGRITLLSSADLLTNLRLRDAGDVSDVAAWLSGGPADFVFVETHLGVFRENTILDLLLRYRLHGALVGVFVFLALLSWRNGRLAAATPPLSAESVAGIEGGSFTDGFHALLEARFPVVDLPAACLSTWRSDVSPVRLSRVPAGNLTKAAHLCDTPAANAADALERVRQMHELLKPVRLDPLPRRKPE
jgi:hypothetical protein